MLMFVNWTHIKLTNLGLSNNSRASLWNSYNRLVHPSVDDMDRAALYFHKKFDLELIGNLRLHFLWVKHAIVGIPEKTDL